MVYDGELNNLVDYGTWGTFSTQHFIPFSPLEKKTSSRAYFCPPSYGFIPYSLKEISRYEMPWIYCFWHELRHAEDFTVCSLGIYQELLGSLSEELAVYGLSLIIKRETSSGLGYIKQAMELLPKITILGNISKVSMEVNPTYYQLCPEVTENFADLAYPLLKGYCPKSKITRSEFEAYANRCRQIFEAGKQKASREHRESLTLGKRIVKVYDDTDYVLIIPLIAMQIDLSDFDLVGIPSNELEFHLITHPDRYVPDSRCFSLAKSKTLLNKMKGESMNGGFDLVEESKRIFRHPSLPSRMRQFFNAVVQDRVEKTDAKLAKIGVDSEKPIGLGDMDRLFKAQGIYSSEGASGTVFFLVPPFIEPHKKRVEEYAQNVFSKTYAHELLIRAFAGKRRFSNDFLISLKTSLATMSESVTKPQNYHTAAEVLVKKLFETCEVENILPKSPS